MTAVAGDDDDDVDDDVDDVDDVVDDLGAVCRSMSTTRNENVRRRSLRAVGQSEHDAQCDADQPGTNRTLTAHRSSLLPLPLPRVVVPLNDDVAVAAVA